MTDEKIYWIEFRIREGTIQSTFEGINFVPDNCIDDMDWFHFVSPDKNQAINELIAKLQSLKDE